MFSCNRTNRSLDRVTASAKINALRLEDGQFLNSENKVVAVSSEAVTSEEIDFLPALMGKAENVVMSASDLQVDLVASALDRCEPW